MNTKGLVPIDRDTKLPGGVVVRIERTANPQKFYIHIADLAERPLTAKVRHRKKRRPHDRA